MQRWHLDPQKRVFGSKRHGRDRERMAEEEEEEEEVVVVVGGGGERKEI